MRIVEGIPLVAIKRRKYLKHQVIIVGVDAGELERSDTSPYPNNVAKWVFGPGTENKWPHGDYYVENEYIEPSFQTYHDFASRYTHGDYYAIDPRVTMDLGL